MSSNRKGLPKIIGTNAQRGSVLIELVVAAIIFALVVASVAYYLIYHVGSINNGRAQLKLQRTGSLLMEEMAMALRKGKSVQYSGGPMEVGVSYSDLMVIYPNAPTRCFSFDDANKDIKAGPDYDNLTSMEILDDSHTVGSDTRNHRILCDDLQFVRQGHRVTVKFILRHDLDNGDGPDDLSISFGSTVKLRG